MAQQLVERVGPRKHNFARTGRMALYGGGRQTLRPSQNPKTDICKLPLSRLRPSGDNMVQVPADQDSPQEYQYHHRGPCHDRSDCLCVHEPLRLLEQYGHHGRDESEGQAGQHVLYSVAKELDGVAVCASYQFQAGAVGASGLGCQCRFSG